VERGRRSRRLPFVSRRRRRERRHGPWDYALSLGHEESRGVSAIAPGDQFGQFNPDRDGFKRDSGTVRLGFTPAPGHRIGVHLLETRLNAQYDATEPPFFDDPSPDFRNRLVTRVASLDYRGKPTSAWTTTLQASSAVDDLTSGGNIQSRFITRREQATWQNALALAAGQQLVLAYEHVEERASADAFPTEQIRRNDAGVLGYSGTFGDHALQADVRRDHSSVWGGVTTGRVGYAFALGSGVKLRALAGTTFRAPTFNDLFFPGFGVPTIQPERGRSAEVGASWQGDGATLSATLYRNRVRDLIVFEPDRTFCPPDPAFDFGCAANRQRARLQGATLTATGRWRDLDLRANVDFLDAKDEDTASACRAAPRTRRASRRLRRRRLARRRVGALRRLASRQRRRPRRLRRLRPSRRLAAAPRMAGRSAPRQRARPHHRAGARLSRPRPPGVARRAL
jgi:vitamin B12 transporter